MQAWADSIIVTPGAKPHSRCTSNCFSLAATGAEHRYIYPPFFHCLSCLFSAGSNASLGRKAEDSSGRRNPRACPLESETQRHFALWNL